MEFFIFDEDMKEVKLNKVWIRLVPEFNNLLKRDKGSKGDSKGELKLKARKEFILIYFYKSFGSPIRDYEEDEKLKEALYYADMQESEIDEGVRAAMNHFEQMQLKASRPLRTLQAVHRGLDALDEYYENLDFSLKDKMGKLLNAPEAFVKNISEVNKAYAAVKELEKRVDEDLKAGTTGIRGKATLGANESKIRQWSESDISKGSQHAAEGSIQTEATFSSILKSISVEKEPVKKVVPQNEISEDKIQFGE